MTIKLPMDVEIEMNTRLPYDFDDIIRKIFKEYLGEAKTENLDFNKLILRLIVLVSISTSYTSFIFSCILVAFSM